MPRQVPSPGVSGVSAKGDRGPLLGALLDSIDECVLVEDDAGRIAYANHAADVMLGYSPGELLGKPVTILGQPLAWSGGRPADAAPEGGFGAQTMICRRKDGREIRVAHLSRPIAGDAGKGLRRAIILRDATYESRLREQLLQSEKMSSVGQLVSGVAHDLNNPLTSVVGYAQLLMSRDVDARFRRGLEVIAAEAERAARIVRNLLTFAREHPPEKQHLGLNEIIEKTLELKAHDFQVKAIDIVLDLDPDLPMTLLDFHQIQQLLLNLLINAEQAIHARNPRGTIRISTRRDGPGLRLTIDDDGPGIAPDVLPKIFDPFFTTKPPGLGTGLGLSICHGIVAEHGGVIHAENREERGARVLIDLPILGPEPPEDSARGEGTEAAGADRASKQILVIDNEPAIQDVLVALLSTEGHRVDTASSGDIALRKLEGRRYDMILSALRVPGDGGPSFYDRLRAHDSRLAERVVFMTGDPQSEESRRILERTANLHLGKPFTVDDLREALRRFEDRFPSS